MFRNIIISLLICAAVVVNPAAAQQIVGTWESVASYGGTPQNLIDTKDKVFVLAQSNLSSYDKKSTEILAYDKSNFLSDQKILNIFYNHDKKYLLVAYQNSNVDVIFDNGKVINFPEIMNAPLTSTKDINDVAFSGDRAYLATNFGLVVINTKKGIVEETGIYGAVINAVAVTSDRIFLTVHYDKQSLTRGTYVAPLEGSHTRFNVFTYCSEGSVPNLEAASGNVLYGASGSLWKATFNPDNNSLTYRQITPYSNLDNIKFQRTATGFSIHTRTNASSSSNYLILLDKEGNVIKDQAIPAGELRQNAFGCYEGNLNAVWAANGDGFGKYDFSSNSFAIRRMIPNGTSGPNVGRIRQAPDGSIYFMTLGGSNDANASYSGWIYVNRLKDGRITNMSPNPLIGTGYSFVPDALNSDYYTLCTRAGIYSVRDGKHTLYNSSNSTITPGIVPMIVEANFDKDQNLWFMLHWDDPGADNLYVVPRDKWAAGPEKNDFIATDFGTEATCHSSTFMIHSSGLIIYSGTSFIGAYDTKGTPLDIKDDRYTNLQQSVDEDGMSLNGAYVNTMIEDHNGWIWMASTGGIRVIKDPKKIFESGFHVSRPKVPRNDGTNLADYLLDNENVMDISVDANNTKWFATNGSGLYRTNADGSMILDHFTTANSDIISDNVYAVFADPGSNKVYVGTDVGVCIYHSANAPAADDYSDVYAYPNPVTPDYTGDITITGLMDKSLVKIADAAGNVFHQTVSEGGMVTWDGCDPSGARVKSGVYFVFASQNSSDSSGVVTKILVIN